MSETSDREPLREENQTNSGEPAAGAAETRDREAPRPAASEVTPPENTQREAPEGQRPGSTRRSLTPSNVARLALGGTLLAADSVDERLQQSLEQVPEAESHGTPDRESVLIPREQWGEIFGDSAGQQTRYMMIGMAAESREAANKGLERISAVSTRLGSLLARLLKPITGSALASPVIGGFNALEKKGESRVNRWIERGRITEARSRTMAESTVNQLLNNSMDELADNPRVQLFIQDIVEAQGMGLAGEGVEELRERAVSSDMFVEAHARSILRRTPRDLLPDPPFRDRLLHSGPLPLDPFHLHGLRGQYAGFISRLLAFVIDLVLVSIGLSIAGRFISLTLNLFSLDQALRAIAGLISSGVIATILFFSYFAIAWFATGQTLGMLTMGLRVVGPDGGYPSLWQAVRRVIGYFIAAMFFFLGFAWIIVDDRRQGWHDKIGSTFVVYSWAARPDESFLLEQRQAIRRRRQAMVEVRQEGASPGEGPQGEGP